MNGSEIISWNQYFQRFNMALRLPKLKEIQSADSKRKSAIMEPIRPLLLSIRDTFNEPIMKIYEKYDAAKKIMKQTQKTIRTTPTLSELSLYRRNAIYSMSKAQNMLGYRPRFDVGTGLQLTAGWLEHEGLLFNGASRG